ncbi:MAG TPA: TRAFs-binding domain-containing protein [Thermoanaerobaculia bacterium]
METDPKASVNIRPICFMVMPFGTKPTLAPPDRPAPATIDFNALWEKAYAPAIRELNYDPVRADEDVGSLIIQEMLERLAISDLVIADLTIPNANVYYEIGIRHAARAQGCVLVSADWTKPLFDVDQMRRITFPLPEGTITDETAAAIRQALVQGIPQLAAGKTPPFASISGFPGPFDLQRTQTFQALAKRLSEFQAEVTAVRRTVDRNACSDAARALAQRYAGDAAVHPSVAMELLYLLRDCVGWQEMLGFLKGMPESLRDLPVVREQWYLAQSKIGSHLEAAGALEELIRTFGATSEREGLVGGRYKKLYDEAVRQRNVQAAREYLNRAIEHYDRGMRLDLNDYYPSSNLPRLLRLRARTGDEQRAVTAVQVARIACERALERNPKDDWALLTLLGVAFDAGDVEAATRLYERIADDGPPAWKLETTLADLRLSIQLQQDPEKRQALTSILGNLEALLPKR